MSGEQGGGKDLGEAWESEKIWSKYILWKMQINILQNAMKI